MKRLFAIGITGASGAIYGHRLIQHLKKLGHGIELVCTEAGKKVSKYERVEEGFSLADKFYPVDDYFAPMASGSYPLDGMVIIPCSMGTLGKIASGIGDNLLCRAADVQLKENRKLILVPRETPLNLIHLENMERCIRAGAIVLPANPHFYQRPQSLEDLVDTVLARVLDHLEVQHEVGKRWGS